MERVLINSILGTATKVSIRMVSLMVMDNTLGAVVQYIQGVFIWVDATERASGEVTVLQHVIPMRVIMCMI